MCFYNARLVWIPNHNFSITNHDLEHFEEIAKVMGNGVWIKISENLKEFLSIRAQTENEFMGKIPREKGENNDEYLDRVNLYTTNLSIIKFFEEKYKAFSYHLLYGTERINEIIKNCKQKEINKCIDDLYSVSAGKNLDDWVIKNKAEEDIINEKIKQHKKEIDNMISDMYSQVIGK